MICEKLGKIKFKYRDLEFWRWGYYVDTAVQNAKKSRRKNQLNDDKTREQPKIPLRTFYWKQVTNMQRSGPTCTCLGATGVRGL